MATNHVKLPDLIHRWIEVQKKATELERSKPLDIDAINLTLMLKSMGLRLQYLDFEAEKSNADNLTITVKCNRSGMKAELSYELLRCSCPEKTDRESSFWEVQGTGPTVFSKFRNNASSNLLPDVSESCALVSKAMLSNLLDFYEASIREVKEGKEQAVLHSPLKSPRPNVSVISPGLTMKKPFSTPPAEGKCSARTLELVPGGCSAVEQKPKEQNIEGKDGGRKDETIPNSSSMVNVTSGECDTKSNSSSESVGINNKTHEMLNSDHPANKPVVDATVSPAHTSVADDHAYEAMKTLVTSSPNIKPAMTPDAQLDRDRNVISYLQEARSQIDIALLLMKVNTTQNVSNGFGGSVTPHHANTGSRKPLVSTPKLAQPRSSSLLSIERRRPPADAGAVKKIASATTLQSIARLSFGSGTGRADTPRPSVAQVKSVAALRKPAGMRPVPLGGTPQAQQPTVGLKKPSTGSIGLLSSQRKLLPPNATPTTSGRTIPKSVAPGRQPSGTGLIQRSSSASYISKK